MSSSYRIFFVAMLFIAVCNAEDMYVGTTGPANKLAYTETVSLSSIPLKTRVKNVFYNSDNSSMIIKGIAAIDIDKTKASPTITSGGVGFTYVNVKIKSSRGDGLNYLVQIYV